MRLLTILSLLDLGATTIASPHNATLINTISRRGSGPNSNHKLYPWITPGGERKPSDVTSPHSTCKLRDDSDPGDKVIYCPMGYPFTTIGADKISVALYKGEDCVGFADHCAPRDEFCPSSNIQQSEGKGMMIAHHFATPNRCLNFPNSDVWNGIDKIAFHIDDWGEYPRHKPKTKMAKCKLVLYAERKCKGYPLLGMDNGDQMKCLAVPNYIAAARSLKVECKGFS